MADLPAPVPRRHRAQRRLPQQRAQHLLSQWPHSVHGHPFHQHPHCRSLAMQGSLAAPAGPPHLHSPFLPFVAWHWRLQRGGRRHSPATWSGQNEMPCVEHNSETKACVCTCNQHTTLLGSWVTATRRRLAGALMRTIFASLYDFYNWCTWQPRKHEL